MNRPPHGFYRDEDSGFDFIKALKHVLTYADLIVVSGR